MQIDAPKVVDAVRAGLPLLPHNARCMLDTYGEAIVGAAAPAIQREAFEDAIEMINGIQMWGLSTSQKAAVTLFKKHVSKNLMFIAGFGPVEDDDEPS